MIEDRFRDWVEHAKLVSFSGHLAFDIGAQNGDSTEVLLGGFEKVVALEPAWETYSDLAGMCHRFPGLTTLMTAVADYEGTIKLAEQFAPMLAHTLTDGDERWGVVQNWRDVPCTTINRLTKEYGAPDFIKIDTEGWELAIIRGGITTLKDHKPDLYVEVHHRSTGEKIREIVEPIYGQPPEVTDFNLAPDYYWLTWRTHGNAGG